MKRIFSTLLVLSVFALPSKGQDIQFSQFYAASLYQNPAFAGGAHLNRAIIHERLQWMSLDARFHTTMASFDTYFAKYQSGVGMYFLRDVQGARNFRSLAGALQYAYEVHLSEAWAVRFGLQGEFVSRNINYSVLTFPDQFTGISATSPGFTDPTGVNGVNSRMYVDLGTGVLLYSDNFWGGFSVHHLNTPNQTFVSGESQLPRKYAFTAGYKFRFRDDKDLLFRDHPTPYYLMPTVHYKSQGTADQIDFGLYMIYDHLLAGAWYRGIPVKRTQSIQNNESFVLMVGWELKRSFDIRYSHDFTVSTLSQKGLRTGGSHEINIAMLLHETFKNKGKQKYKRLPCPDHHIHF